MEVNSRFFPCNYWTDVSVEHSDGVYLVSHSCVIYPGEGISVAFDEGSICADGDGESGSVGGGVGKVGVAGDGVGDGVEVRVEVGVGEGISVRDGV